MSMAKPPNIRVFDFKQLHQGIAIHTVLDRGLETEMAFALAFSIGVIYERYQYPHFLN